MIRLRGEDVNTTGAWFVLASQIPSQIQLFGNATTHPSEKVLAPPIASHESGGYRWVRSDLWLQLPRRDERALRAVFSLLAISWRSLLRSAGESQAIRTTPSVSPPLCRPPRTASRVTATC